MRGKFHADPASDQRAWNGSLPSPSSAMHQWFFCKTFYTRMGEWIEFAVLVHDVDSRISHRDQHFRVWLV
jgi:hypothetical protein